jgi:hypothetical protein
MNTISPFPLRTPLFYFQQKILLNWELFYLNTEVKKINNHFSN